jgi:SAM-dependent methyltransferase
LKYGSRSEDCSSPEIAQVNLSPETAIIAQEESLREWFTRECDSIRKVVDGLDIGWGGVQRWATARMPPPTVGLHLDVACGYGTFLAQLGWRFPEVQLVGLNIDFDGPHALAQPLLTRAGVSVALVQGDGRKMPFADGALGSVSCFLGLQDIEIGFGEVGMYETVAEAVRVLRAGGILVLLDAYPLERFQDLLDKLPAIAVDGAQQGLDVCWTRQVAEQAIALYADGWVAQVRGGDREENERIREEVHSRMMAEMERQLTTQGYYVPFGPVCMVAAKKISSCLGI